MRPEGSINHVAMCKAGRRHRRSNPSHDLLHIDRAHREIASMIVRGMAKSITAHVVTAQSILRNPYSAGFGGCTSPLVMISIDYLARL